MHGYPVHDARLCSIIVDGIMLCRAVVPYHHVARRPAPTHGILEPRDVSLQQVVEVSGFALRNADEPPKKSAEQQGTFTGFGMDVDYRMLGAMDCPCEFIRRQRLRALMSIAGLLRIVELIAVLGP